MNLMTDRKYLLVISCSKRKIPCSLVEKIRALDLYDGPFYRIIRKAFRDRGRPKNLDILILSAKYGLISSEKKITNYDKLMTTEIACKISRQVYRKLESIFWDYEYTEIMINLGKKYTLALEYSKRVLTNQNLRYGNGGIGDRNRQLKDWLFTIYEDQ